MSSFDADPRRLQEYRGRPLADVIYKNCLGVVDITRFKEGESEHILDTRYGVDAELRFENGTRITVQEKFLSAETARYNAVSVEYHQDPLEREAGDWFNLASQLYFTSHLNEDETGFWKWAMIDVLQLWLATARGEVEWLGRQNKDGHARASFKYARVDKLPSRCVLYQHGYLGSPTPVVTSMRGRYVVE